MKYPRQCPSHTGLEDCNGPAAAAVWDRQGSSVSSRDRDSSEDDEDDDDEEEEVLCVFHCDALRSNVTRLRILQASPLLSDGRTISAPVKGRLVAVRSLSEDVLTTALTIRGCSKGALLSCCCVVVAIDSLLVTEI